jgi:hypothetical protein
VLSASPSGGRQQRFCPSSSQSALSALSVKLTESIELYWCLQLALIPGSGPQATCVKRCSPISVSPNCSQLHSVTR